MNHAWLREVVLSKQKVPRDELAVHLTVPRAEALLREFEEMKADRDYFSCLVRSEAVVEGAASLADLPGAEIHNPNNMPDSLLPPGYRFIFVHELDGRYSRSSSGTPVAKVWIYDKWEGAYAVSCPSWTFAVPRDNRSALEKEHDAAKTRRKMIVD